MNIKRYQIELTQSQIENLMEFISLDFITSIRNDSSIDNFEYIIDMVNTYQELKRVKELFGLEGNTKNAYKEYCKNETVKSNSINIEIDIDKGIDREIFPANISATKHEDYLCGITNVDDARNTISSTATLSFRDYNDNLLMTSDVLGGQAKVTNDEFGKPAVSLKIKDVDTFYEVTKKVKDMDENVMVIWLDYQVGKDSYRKELLNKDTTSFSYLKQNLRKDLFDKIVLLYNEYNRYL